MSKTPQEELVDYRTTIATLRDWTTRTIETTSMASSHTTARGFHQAAREVLAILNAHGQPPEQPVNMPGWD